MNHKTYRILAEGALMDNDTWVTGINNNDLIIGPSGAGKTRSYVIPNILQGNDSMVVADTKGNLVGDLGPALRKKGFQVVHIDFTDLTEGLPCFLTIATMPLTYSIATGFGFGFVSYACLKCCTGRWREVSPVMWVVSLLFAVNFALR